jgi:predicted aldo/keto reductase-like oxidoreductase
MSSHNLDVALKAVSSGFFEAIMFPFNIISNEAADKLVSLAKEHDVGFLAMKSFAGGTLNDAHLAMKYLLQFDNVVPVPGVEKAQDIEQIVNIVNGSWKLTPHDQRRIREIHTKMSPRFCRQCEVCLPCPKGVFIPGVTYLPILYGLWSREWFLSWRYTTNAFNSAKNCDQCGECEKKCPFKLPIREIISENVKFYEKIAKEEA